jgi:hypothetical protein
MIRSLRGNMEFSQHRKEKMRHLLYYKAVRIVRNKANRVGLVVRGGKNPKQIALMELSIGGKTAYMS